MSAVRHINKRIASEVRIKEKAVVEAAAMRLPAKDCGLRMTKKERKANGGCLGVKSRRRTWYTAKSVGKPCAGADPAMSEWGTPAVRPTVTHR